MGGDYTFHLFVSQMETGRCVSTLCVSCSQCCWRRRCCSCWALLCWIQTSRLVSAGSPPQRSPAWDWLPSRYWRTCRPSSRYHSHIMTVWPRQDQNSERFRPSQDQTDQPHIIIVEVVSVSVALQTLQTAVCYAHDRWFIWLTFPPDRHSFFCLPHILSWSACKILSPPLETRESRVNVVDLETRLRRSKNKTDNKHFKSGDNRLHTGPDTSRQWVDRISHFQQDKPGVPLNSKKRKVKAAKHDAKLSVCLVCIHS